MYQPRSRGPKRKAENVDPTTCKLELQEHRHGKKQNSQESNLRAENNESGEDEGGEPMTDEQEVEGEVPGTETEAEEEEEDAEEFYCEVCDMWCNSRIMMNMHSRGKKHKANKELKKHQVGGGGPREKRGLWCEVCRLRCNSEAVMENHLRGKRHKAKEGAFRLEYAKDEEEERGRKFTEEETGTEKAMTAPMKGEGNAKNGLRCEICDVRCNSEVVMAAHCKGKKHRTKEAKIECKKTKGQGEEMKGEEKMDTKKDEEEGGNCGAAVEASKSVNNVSLRDKQPEELWCLICKVKCDSRATMTTHLKCVEHKERQAQRWGVPIIGATEEKEAEEE